VSRQPWREIDAHVYYNAYPIIESVSE